MSNPFEAPGATSLGESRTSFRLKRIGVLSTGIFGAVAGGLFGIIGGLMMLGLTGISAIFSSNPPSMESNVGFSLGMTIVLPLLYCFFGFFAGLLNAAVYNVVASFTGGIEMEFNRE